MKMSPGQVDQLPPVFRAVGGDFTPAPFGDGLAEICGIERLSAHLATDEIEGGDILPGAFQK